MSKAVMPVIRIWASSHLEGDAEAVDEQLACPGAGRVGAGPFGVRAEQRVVQRFLGCIALPGEEARI